MTIREQMRRDRRAFRELQGRERLNFIWDYYKIPILAAAFALLLAAIGMTTWLQQKDHALYCVLVNTSGSPKAGTLEELDRLLADAGVDMTGRTISIDDSLRITNGVDSTADAQTIQVLAAMFGVSGLDFFAADEDLYVRYAELGAFLDLSHIIPAELLEKHADGLYYVEDEDGQVSLAGIRLTDSPLHSAGYFSREVLAGIAAQAQNMEEARLFLIGLL